MILSVAGNNSINRWKEGVGVPQSHGGGNFGRPMTPGTTPAVATSESEEEHTYQTPTSRDFQDKVTSIVPLVDDLAADAATSPTVCVRPALETREQVEAALAACRKRTARLPLVDEDEAREALGEDAPDGPLPQWARLLANFPRDGKRAVAGIRSANEKGELPPLLKAQLAWIIARQDRAWYALGEAKQRLLDLGQSEDEIYALDGDCQHLSPRERAMFTVARNLAASPMVLTDDQFAKALELSSPREMVQLVSYTTNRASFNRITEAAGLQLEQ